MSSLQRRFDLPTGLILCASNGPSIIFRDQKEIFVKPLKLFGNILLLTQGPSGFLESRVRYFLIFLLSALVFRHKFTPWFHQGATKLKGDSGTWEVKTVSLLHVMLRSSLCCYCTWCYVRQCSVAAWCVMFVSVVLLHDVLCSSV